MCFRESIFSRTRVYQFQSSRGSQCEDFVITVWFSTDSEQLRCVFNVRVIEYVLNKEYWRTSREVLERPDRYLQLFA